MDQYEARYEQAIADQRDIYLAYMEEKYDVSFLPISYSGSGLVTNEEFRCYAEGTDRERDYVSVFRKEENGKEVYYDDYFGILIRDEYESRVDAISDKIVGNTKSFVHRYSVSYFDNALTGEKTLDDAIEMGARLNASKYVYFEVQPGTEKAFGEACDAIADQLRESKLPGFVKFIGLAEGQLEKVSAENYYDFIPSMVSADGEICLMMTERSVSLK